MADSEIGLFEAIYTQRAIRSFKSDPVPEETLRKVIEAATKAPSGGNSQPWAFIVVQDRKTVSAIAEYAKPGFAQMYERALARAKPGDPPPFPRLKPLVDNFEQVPAIVFPCLVRPPGSTGGGGGTMAGASIYPAVQNLLLAARGLGLGAAITGLAMGNQDDVKKLLDVPENVDLVALIPMGFPDTERYGKTTRKPVNEVLHWEGWGNLRD